MTMYATPHMRGSMQTLRRFACIAVLSLCLALVAAPHTTAQALPSVGGTSLELTPATPAPSTSFTVRVNAYNYDIDRARITWSVDGVIREDAANQREITLVAPALGTPMTIRTAVTEPSGATHTTTHAFTPSVVELVVEGDTRTPHFYQGRTLPSEGSTVRLVAFPSLYTASGQLLEAETLLYTWRVGSQVAKSGLGATILETTMPRSGALEVVVTVEAAGSSARHMTGTRIDPAEPVVHFYEDNPLYGLSRVALPKEFTLLAPELSVRAEPYFASRTLFTNARLEWKLDGRPVENPNADPTTLTLRGAGGAGSARVEFSVRNLSALLQAARGSFLIYFTE